MKEIFSGKSLVILVIASFVIITISVFLVEWFDENVTNPRIWKDWSCEEMKNFALTSQDKKLTDFQQARFHEDLSRCMR